MLGGFAIATLLLNTPASIVLFVVYRFVLPGVFAAAGRAERLVRLGRALARLPGRAGRHLRVGPLRPEEWSHLLVSGFIWLALPLGIGMWRILRAEVK